MRIRIKIDPFRYKLRIRFRSSKDHGLINFIDTKAKCLIKYCSCKGTLRQVFITVYRLEIQSVMLLFSTQLSELLPLLSGSTLPSPPCVNKYTVYTYTMCKRGGDMGVLGLKKVNTCRKVPSQVNFFRWQITDRIRPYRYTPDMLLVRAENVLI